MKCSRVEDRLPLYVSGELSARTNRKVGLHLEACPRCRTMFETYLALRTNLRVVGEELPEGQLAGFFDSLESRLLPALPAKRRTTRPAWSRHPAVRSAAVLVVMTVIGWASYAVWPREHLRLDRVAPGPSEDMRSEMIVSQDVLNRPIGNVRPYVSVAAPSRSLEPGPIRPAVLDRDVWIMAGPRVSVPLEPPAWPVSHRVREIQPYARSATPTRAASFTMY